MPVPIATSYSIDPIYLGFLFVMDVAIGGITPPVGIVLFVVSGMWKIRISQEAEARMQTKKISHSDAD